MDHTAPHVVEECLGILRVYSDGSIWREKPENVVLGGVPVLDIRTDDTVVFKDCNHDPHHGLSLRLYRPKSASPNCLLPVIFYIHGGGFCLGSCRWNLIHNSCLRLASALGAVVVSPDYRLAPEFRLPAAIDDVLGAVEWVRARLDGGGGGGDQWWSGVDFDRVFVVGDSSGGNLAHHLVVRLGMGSAAAVPVRTRGYVLLSPFFGGVARVPSEEGPPDPILDLEGIDRLWRLALPEGENRDHPFSNPFGPSSPSLEHIALDPILVFAGGNEIMRDRISDYVQKLRDMGKRVHYSEFEGQHHSFFTGDPYSGTGDKVIQVIRQFMSECE